MVSPMSGSLLIRRRNCAGVRRATRLSPTVRPLTSTSRVLKRSSSPLNWRAWWTVRTSGWPWRSWSEDLDRAVEDEEEVDPPLATLEHQRPARYILLGPVAREPARRLGAEARKRLGVALVRVDRVRRGGGGRAGSVHEKGLGQRGWRPALYQMYRRSPRRRHQRDRQLLGVQGAGRSAAAGLCVMSLAPLWLRVWIHSQLSATLSRLRAPIRK